MTTTVLAYIPSPSQGVWHLFGLPIRAYALFIIAGIIAALVIGDRRWVARGGEPGVIYDVALWAVPFGLLGGRLYHVLTDWPTYFGENGLGFLAALRIWDGGLGIWGAVALGAIGAWIACRRRGIPLPAFGDAIAPGIVLAQAIGRLGNYFNQELYGRETTMPWGLEIYERVNAAGVPDSLNGVSNGQLVQVVHPTFLYELLWNLLVFAVLIVVDRRFKIGHGRLFALYVAGYCAGRFWIELMRSDTATLLAGIRINSFTATFVFIGAVVYIMAAPKGREAPETLRGKQDAESDAEELAKDLAVASAAGAGIVAAAKVAEDDEATETDGQSGGLGAVEGDEAIEAAEGAPIAHDVAAEGDAEAEALAAQLLGPDDSDVEPWDDAVSEADVDAVSEAEAEGLGAVDGGEVAAAVSEAPEAHEVAVEGEAAAEELAAEVEAEAEPAADVEAEVETEGLGAVEGDEVAAAVSEAPETEGLGAVEGGEVAAAVSEAPEAHEAAVDGEAEAEELAAEVEAEAEPAADADSDAEADELPAEVEADAGSVAEADVEAVAETEGLGAVEGGEVAAAVSEAPEVHDAAVEGEAAAGELAAEVESEAEPVEADAESVAEADVEAVAETEGLGAVEGDEVAAAVSEAPEVHDAAVEGEAEAGELAAEVESEAEPVEADAGSVAEADVEAVAETEGLGAVEGGEVAAAVSEAPEVHDAAVEGEAEAGELAAEVEAEAGPAGAATPDDADEGEPTDESADTAETPAPVDEAGPVDADRDSAPTRLNSVLSTAQSRSRQVASAVGGRAREWARRRRNR